MSGHSKWSTIKRKKGANDAKRSSLFSKLNKEITIAAKLGGPDLDGNPRLRLAVQNARGANMPKDNIERAIKKATATDGENYQEVTYEGYAPGGIAIYVECTTDNLNRTVANIRSYFNKAGGSLATNGSLDFIFDRKGVFELPHSGQDEEEFTFEMLDAGADDVQFEEGYITVTCPMEAFGQLQTAFDQAELSAENAGLKRLPNIFKKVPTDDLPKVLKLLETIEDDDDVQAVYHNIEMDDEVMNAL